MSNVNKELYDAFRAIGIDEERARAAAEALNSQFIAKEGESQLATKQAISDLDKKLAIVKAGIATVENILWAVALCVLALVLKAFIPMIA